MYQARPRRTVGSRKPLLAEAVMTMTGQTNRIQGSAEPVTYLELAGRIDWRESGSSTRIDDAPGSWYDPSEPQGLLWAA
jgi:hypothetical protein